MPPGRLDVYHLAPFALYPAFPDSLAGRYSRDYYGASVIRPARAWRMIPCSSLPYVSSAT